MDHCESNKLTLIDSFFCLFFKDKIGISPKNMSQKKNT